MNTPPNKHKRFSTLYEENDSILETKILSISDLGLLIACLNEYKKKNTVFINSLKHKPDNLCIQYQETIKEINCMQNKIDLLIEYLKTPTT